MTVRTFLPWVRQGLAASTARVDTLGAGVAGSAQRPLTATVNARRDATADVPVRLLGPGDVTGIDPQEIVRTDPRPFASDVEPNYLALVEFDPPDFPWLFTPARADAAGRIRPWLVLVVVEKRDRVLDTARRDRLPTLRAPRAELSDLGESWAWAHAQVTTDGATDRARLERAIASRSERTVSRIVCPRRLRPQVTYLACVVPAFEAGRKAGLGEHLVAADLVELGPAWSGGSPDTVLLPVYHHWEFTTGVGGDFESLARRLRPRALPPSVGVLRLDVSNPRWGLQATGLGVAELEGALRSPTGLAKPPRETVEAALAQPLRAILTGANAASELTPPSYGLWYTNEAAVPPPGTPPRWLSDVNLDPRDRLAAGLGTSVVRYEQERLMASAWEQLAEHRHACEKARLTNAAASDTQEQLSRRQLAEEVAAALQEKHVQPMRPDQLVQVAGPALGDAAPTQADPAFRRLMRPGGPVAARAGGDGAPAEPSSVHAAAPPEEAAAAEIALSVAQEELGRTRATEDERFAPTFSQPMYESLRDWHEGMLLPGLDGVPPNTIALLETNPRFVEAFMLGLNHELSRELVWRGFPTNRRGTYFRRFWAAPAGTADAGSITAIEEWPPDSRLGTHMPGTGTASELVLLIRGDLLKRFPRALVSAVEATWAGGKRVPGTNERPPTFRGTSGADVTFLGFRLTEAEARGSTNPAKHPGWFFVLQEQPSEPRFGFDDEDRPARAVDAVAAWDELSWADVAEDAASSVRVAGRWATKRKPLRSGSPSATVTWGANSAAMAAITQQAPFRIAIHASEWLDKEDA